MKHHHPHKHHTHDEHHEQVEDIKRRAADEAARLPLPTTLGAWTISPGNIRFRVAQGLDMRTPAGHYSLAWEACENDLTPLGVFTRITHFPSPLVLP